MTAIRFGLAWLSRPLRGMTAEGMAKLSANDRTHAIWQGHEWGIGESGRFNLFINQWLMT
jgi:hypothetical protein